MLNLSFLDNKEIVVLGAGITGLSCARFLSKHGIKFSLNDSRKNIIDSHEFNQQFAGNYLSLGHWDKALINSADIVLASPGIDLNNPEIAGCLNDEGEVFGDVELYCRLTQVPTIAVTGSNGKSTVVSLLAFLGERLGYNTQLGGNIGIPVLDTIEQRPDFLILELSSFQLETMTNMQARSACVLNVCDDHLDRHATIDNYQKIKQEIYRQTDIAVINRDDSRTALPEILTFKTQYSFGLEQPLNATAEVFGLQELDGQQWLISGQQALIAVAELPLAGIHNALNCLAALALGKAAGWSLTDMVKALPDFVGLEHRCQPVATNDGIRWINDSKATNVGATIAAINGFASNKSQQQDLYLIAGGDGKGADFSELAPAIKQHVFHTVTLGKDGGQIAALTSASSTVSTLADAVNLVKSQAKSGDIVLLSPACASIDMFKNYIERGLAFIDAVQGEQTC
ncbi:MAG: UDP-N-acetylmuramoyl-L-alanine--D-glutamate ligase [Thalassotalea sp.]